MNTPILLYTPSTIEVELVTNSAKQRHPELASRLDKAAEIILTGGLQLDGTAWEKGALARWRIASQSHAGAYVIVGFNCPCEDSKRASIVGSVNWCKHNLAIAMYLKILRNRLNTDIRNREIDLGILPDRTFNAYAKRMGAVHLRKDASTYAFVNVTSAVHYSLWVAARAKVVTPTPTLVWAGHSVTLAAAA